MVTVDGGSPACKRAATVPASRITRRMLPPASLAATRTLRVRVDTTRRDIITTRPQGWPSDADMTEAAPPAGLEFLDLGSATGRLIAGFDWNATSLGPIAGWPPPLKTATGMILRSPAAFVLLWGDEGV